jgi:hypothetical protein
LFRNHFGSKIVFVYSSYSHRHAAGACKQQPVDAVYYGQRVNTYTEEYNYATDSTSTLTEEHWPKQSDMKPHIMIRSDQSDYFQFLKNKSGKLAANKDGKWSIRNNNEITIQTEGHLFYKKIVLLNGALSIEGQSYPLDENRKEIRTPQ